MIQALPLKHHPATKSVPGDTHRVCLAKGDNSLFLDAVVLQRMILVLDLEIVVVHREVISRLLGSDLAQEVFLDLAHGRCLVEGFVGVGSVRGPKADTVRGPD